MNTPEETTVDYEFATVESGWDREQVRAALDELAAKIASLESRLPGGGSPDGRGVATGTDANAEKAADVHARAIVMARRLRERAAEDAREMSVKARAEALEIIKAARRDADDLLKDARAREEQVFERVRVLQTIVRRTEVVLRAVADGEYGGGSGDAGEGIEVVAAAQQSRVARHLQRAVASDEPLPQSVKRLLKALKANEPDLDD